MHSKDSFYYKGRINRFGRNGPAAALIAGVMGLFATIASSDAMTFAQALGTTNVIWRTGGDAAWFVDTSTIQNGRASIRSGAVTIGQQSWIEAQISGPVFLSCAGRGYTSIWLGGDHCGVTYFQAIDDLEGPSSFSSLPLESPSNVMRWINFGVGVSWLDAVEIEPDLKTPFIVNRPADTLTTVGYDLTLAVVASGEEPLAYYWSKDGHLLEDDERITGSRTASLQITDVVMADAGGYSVLVSNRWGEAIDGFIDRNGAGLSCGAGAFVGVSTVTPVLGAFTGLFFSTNGAAPESSGWFRLNNTKLGAFSGRIRMGGKTHSFTGRFDDNGRASVTVRRAHAIPLLVELRHEYRGTDRLVGTVSDGAWTAELLAHRTERRVSYKLPPSPYAGRYTVAILGNTNDWLRFGHGFATLKVDRKGRAVCAGLLADGTKFSRSVYLATDGSWPFYVACRGPGMAVGWLAFTNGNDCDLKGTLAWIPSPPAGSGYFPGAEPANRFLAIGSRYESPEGSSVVLNWPESSPVQPPAPAKAGARRYQNFPGTAEFAGGNLLQAFTNSVVLRSDNKFFNESENDLVLKLRLSNGYFTGYVVEPSYFLFPNYMVGGTKIRIRGVLLQKQNAGYGFFVDEHASGSVILRGEG